MLRLNKDIEIINIIGKGAYGDVYMGRNLRTKEVYAIKKITKKQLESETIYQYFNNEIFILKHLNHPNIIAFKSLIDYKADIYLSTEYCNGGNLEQAMKYHLETFKKPISENIARYFIFNILQGIIYLNKNNLIHRDIKSDNILLHFENEEDLITHNFLKAKIKIIDFGFARYLEQNELAGSLVGTPMYMEPSILKTFMTSKSRVVDGFYDKKVDVWSLGILTYELLIGIVPFIARNIKGLFHSVEQRDFCIPKEEKRNLELSEAAINFIDRTLNIDMNMRPLPEELIKDPWIMGKFDKKNLFKMKSDKEIALVEKKTNFANFWKPVKKLNDKLLINNDNANSNNVNSRKKNKLEIIGLSYIDPSKKYDNDDEKKLHNNRLKKILESKHKKLLNNYNLKIRGKTLKILSKIERNKNSDELSNITNKTDRTFNINYNNNNNNNNIEDEKEESGVPLLNTLKSDKQNEKLKSICKIDVSNMNKFKDSNFYINNTISSCRHNSTSGNFNYFRSPKKNKKFYTNFNGRIIQKLKPGKNTNSFRSLKTDKNKNTIEIKYSYNNLENKIDFNNNIINQSNITNYINNINNNIFINTNNNSNSYCNQENRIYRKKFSFKKTHANSINNNINKEENTLSEKSDIYKFKKVEKPKAIRLKKLELFKIPVYNSKIKNRLQNIDNNEKNEEES